jgi:hypothetical protein
MVDFEDQDPARQPGPADEGVQAGAEHNVLPDAAPDAVGQAVLGIATAAGDLILTGANLVTTIWRGREKLHYLNAAPINEIAERWVNHYDQPRVTALSDLKKALEGTAMSKPEFVYTTYINTTPERLWQGAMMRI